MNILSRFIDTGAKTFFPSRAAQFNNLMRNIEERSANLETTQGDPTSLVGFYEKAIQKASTLEERERIARFMAQHYSKQVDLAHAHIWDHGPLTNGIPHTSYSYPIKENVPYLLLSATAGQAELRRELYAVLVDSDPERTRALLGEAEGYPDAQRAVVSAVIGKNVEYFLDGATGYSSYLSATLTSMPEHVRQGLSNDVADAIKAKKLTSEETATLLRFADMDPAAKLFAEKPIFGADFVMFPPVGPGLDRIFIDLDEPNKLALEFNPKIAGPQALSTYINSKLEAAHASSQTVEQYGNWLYQLQSFVDRGARAPSLGKQVRSHIAGNDLTPNLSATVQTVPALTEMTRTDYFLPYPADASDETAGIVWRPLLRSADKRLFHGSGLPVQPNSLQYTYVAEAHVPIEKMGDAARLSIPGDEFKSLLSSRYLEMSELRGLEQYTLGGSPTRRGGEIPRPRAAADLTS